MLRPDLSFYSRYDRRIRPADPIITNALNNYRTLTSVAETVDA